MAKSNAKNFCYQNGHRCKHLIELPVNGYYDIEYYCNCDYKKGEYEKFSSECKGCHFEPENNQQMY